MRFLLSNEAEEQLDLVEQTEPSNFELLVADLQLLDLPGAGTLEVGLIVGQWVWISGPTGRVSYWVSPIGDDEWLIETIQVF
jgi:hypothetical protein